MPPYLIGLHVQYPSGTNLDNLNVTCRIDYTNESSTKTTSNGGEVYFQLGDENDFPSGFSVGDYVTVYAPYQGYEQYFSFAIPSTGQSVIVTDNSGNTVGTATGGGLTGDLVLVSVLPSPTIRLFNIQEFLDFCNLSLYAEDKENGIKPQQVVRIGEQVTKEIEERTGQKWDTNSGSYYSQTEYIDTNEDIDFYFLSKTPIYSITNIYTCDRDEESVPDYTNFTSSWYTLETSDYMNDTETGRIVITDGGKRPSTRRRGIYADYKYGQSVPADIKKLALLMAKRTLMSSTYGKTLIEGHEQAIDLDKDNIEIERILTSRTKMKIFNT